MHTYIHTYILNFHLNYTEGHVIDSLALCMVHHVCEEAPQVPEWQTRLVAEGSSLSKGSVLQHTGPELRIMEGV